MPRSVTLWAEKGGVGKTTFAVNLAAGLARRENDVLAIDLDHQEASLTEWFGFGELIDADLDEPNIAERLVDENLDLEGLIRATGEGTGAGSLDVAPAHSALANFSEAVAGESAPLFFLREELTKLSEEYDYFIVDAPASRGRLSDNAIIATRNVLVPMPMGHAGVQSIRGIEETIQSMETGLNRGPFDVDLNLLGVVPNRVGNRNIEKQGYEHLKQNETMFIPLEVRERGVLEDAWSTHSSIFAYDEQHGLRGYESDVLEQFDKLSQLITGEWVPEQPHLGSDSTLETEVQG